MSVGLATAYIASYNSECAPARIRGFALSLFTIIGDIGALVGSGINFATYNKTSKLAYRIPFATEIVCPVILMFGIWLVPESPREQLLWTNGYVQGL